MGAGKDAAAEFRAERLPGARFFDLDGVADKSTDLPHMLPSEAQFAAAADALGVSKEDAVVVYDRQGLFSAPRAWWTWRVLGHERVAVLDGGLPAWRAAGGAVDTSPVGEEELRAGAAAAQAPPQHPPRYRASLRQGEVRGWQEVLANVASGEELVIDARPAARWQAWQRWSYTVAPRTASPARAAAGWYSTATLSREGGSTDANAERALPATAGTLLASKAWICPGFS